MEVTQMVVQEGQLLENLVEVPQAPRVEANKTKVVAKFEATFELRGALVLQAAGEDIKAARKAALAKIYQLRAASSEAVKQVEIEGVGSCRATKLVVHVEHLKEV